MKIAVFLNNRVGAQIAQWLGEHGQRPAIAVLHPEERRKFGPEIMASLDLPPHKIRCATELITPGFRDILLQEGIQIGLSAFFGYILPKHVLEVFPSGVLNLHPSFLPYNRGAYPNVWPLLDGTPAGVTLHFLDEGIDTGDIVFQERTVVLATDTGKNLYERLEADSMELFKKSWPRIVQGDFQRIPQSKTEGTVHRTSECSSLDKISLDALYTAHELINLIRARTFPPHKGAFFEVDGRKIFLNIQLEGD